MFQTKFAEKIKTHFVFNKFFSGNGATYKVMCKKYGRAREATDGNINRNIL
jgi:hypothetical protein